MVLHAGAYLGFSTHRRLPDAYGLRALWEETSLAGFSVNAIPANESFGNFTIVENMLVPTNYSL
jgi:hypothetical protein